MRKILFYGTDTLSRAVLSQLHHHGYDILSVTKHTTTPVHRYCVQHGIPVQVFQRGTTPPFHQCERRTADLGVVASFGDMIPASVIRSTRNGFVNVHPSLIPKYKGPAPLLHTLLNGDTHYGITLLEALPRSFDKGHILSQSHLEIPSVMTGRQFWDHTARHMAESLVTYLATGPDFKGREQDLSLASSAPKITPKQMKTLVRVCPHLQTADQIFNISRCADIFKLSPIVSWQGKALKLKQIHLIHDRDIVEVLSAWLQPGQFVPHDGVLLLRCAGDSVLGVSSIVLPYKDVQSAARFHRDQCHGSRVRRVFEMLYDSQVLDEVNGREGKREKSNRLLT